MKEKTSKILLVLLPISAALMLQACFYGGGYRYRGQGPYAPPAYSPAYAAPPAYTYRPPPPVYGAYDQHHQWHDRDWWLKNDRPWVEHHHPTWLGHDHDRDDHHDHDHH